MRPSDESTGATREERMLAMEDAVDGGTIGRGSQGQGGVGTGCRMPSEGGDIEGEAAAMGPGSCSEADSAEIGTAAVRPAGTAGIGSSVVWVAWQSGGAAGRDEGCGASEGGGRAAGYEAGYGWMEGRS